MVNESYLNADALAALFLEPLEPYRARIPALIFEFGARGASPREFGREARSVSGRAAADVSLRRRGAQSRVSCSRATSIACASIARRTC